MIAPVNVAETIRSIKHYFKDKKVILLTGVMADKNYKEMAASLSEVASEVFTLTPANDRALRSDELACVYTELGVPSHPHATVEQAAKAAVECARLCGSPILCAGSLYMYKEIKQALLNVTGE